jgi:hypothetical protein
MTDKAAPMRQLAIAALSVVAMARPAESIAATAAGAPIHAQASEDATPAAATPAGWNVEYGEKGLEIASPDRSWSFEPEFQVQLRFSDPFDDDPRTVADIDSPPGSDFEIRRARFKFDAQLGAEWLTLYSQTDLDGPVQLDLQVTIEPEETFGVRLGQWKAEYNRERRDSSGSQQFVDRSIVNREFTVDRQQGAMLFGRLRRGGTADVSAWAGVFGGEGRGHFNDGGEPMYLARFQWNPNGRVLVFSQGDVRSRRARSLSQQCATAAATRASHRMAAAISMASSPVRSISTRSSSGSSNRRSSGAAFPGSRNGTRSPWRIASPVQQHVFEVYMRRQDTFFTRPGPAGPNRWNWHCGTRPSIRMSTMPMIAATN